MKDRYVFNIPGDPIRIFKTGDRGRQTFDTYMENKLRYIVTLELQYENENIITSPIEAIFKFFLPRSHKYRQRRVSLIKLFEFANYVSEGVIYKKDCFLYNITLFKEYSNDPHTEIVIIPIKNINGGTNEFKGPKNYKNKKSYHS